MVVSEVGWMNEAVVKKFSDGVLAITDDTNTTTVILEEGGLSHTVTQPFTWHKNRGALHHRRLGEEEAPQLTFSAKYCGFYSSTNDEATPYEALGGVGQGASWTSTTAAGSDVHSVDMTLTITDPVTSATEIMTFPDVALISVDCAEGEEASVLAFTCDYNPADQSGILGPTLTGT